MKVLYLESEVRGSKFGKGRKPIKGVLAHQGPLPYLISGLSDQGTLGDCVGYAPRALLPEGLGNLGSLYQLLSIIGWGLFPGHQLPGISGLSQERAERKSSGREGPELAEDSCPMYWNWQCRGNTGGTLPAAATTNCSPVTQALKIRVSWLKSFLLHFCWWRIDCPVFFYSLIVFCVYFKRRTLFYSFVVFTVLRKYIFPVSWLLGSSTAS